MPARKRRQAAARKPTAKPGRPSKFTQALADEICRRMAEQGQTLRAVCRDEAMPAKSTVLKWLGERAEFSDQYARAREAQADHWADEMVEIADDGTGDTWIDDKGRERVNNDVIQRSAVRIDTRKWLMARMAPKKYGNKVELGGKGGGPIMVHIKKPSDGD